MAGAREGGREAALLSPSTPRNMSMWGGSPSVSCLPPPHSTKQKEKPPPPGATPTPTWAVHSVVFSSPMAQGATGGGGSPSVSESQLDSGSDPGLLVHSGTHSLCRLFFGSTQTYQSHRPIRNIPPKSETKNWLFSCRPLIPISVSLSPM